MGWPEEMGRAAKEVRFRLDAPLLAYCDIKDIDAVNSGGAAINDVIYANPVFNADVIGPHSRVFVDRFKQRTGASPTLEDACCYDAVMLLADSMKSGHTTADAIGQMLRELQGYDGVAGRLQFTKGVVRGHYEISRVKPI
jgi:ABC-type branched-subunit amino acid transport system substrate-binding protein